MKEMMKMEADRIGAAAPLILRATKFSNYFI